MPGYQPIKELFRKVQDHPARHAIVPLECRLSWPVPMPRTSEGKLYLTAFFYAAPAVAGQPRELRRPLFQVAIDPEDGSLAAIVRCSLQDFAAAVVSGPVVGLLQPQGLAAPTIPDLRRLHEEFFATYDQALPLAFQDPAKLTPEALDVVSRFRNILERLIEPPLRPFYHALSPAFFAWLERVLPGDK